MKDLHKNPHFYLLLFFVINLLQAILTPISRDEAYYWMYAHQLDWGYFDHPPMIALFIYIGNLFFKGVMGVRLMTTLFTTLTVWVVWKLVPQADREKKNSLPLFFLLAFSLPIFNIYGFITTPDVPLLLFSALYMLIYLRFTETSNLKNALMLGLVAALLMYSKYHGAFVIIFSIVANIRLLWNRWFYLAGIVALLLYFPHIHWQYEHEFISFRYHLYQRTDGFMGGKHIFDYLLNAFLVLNPFLFGLFLYFIFGKKRKSDLPRLFPMILWGFLGFFTFTSIRDHIEPQWIGVASIPLLILLFHFLVNDGLANKYVKSVTIISLILIAVLRLAMVLPLPVNSEFHRQKASFYEDIQVKSAGQPLVFINTYYDAAKYTFYTGKPAFSYNCYDYRKNQYDLWDYEEIYHKSPVFFVSGYPYPWADSSFVTEGREWRYDRIPSFPMINKTTAEWVEVNREPDRNSMQQVTFIINNPYSYPLEFDHPEMPLKFFMIFQVERDRTVIPMSTDGPFRLEAGEEKLVKGNYRADIPPGKYRVAVGLQPLKVSPVLITEKIEVEVH